MIQEVTLRGRNQGLSVRYWRGDRVIVVIVGLVRGRGKVGKLRLH